MSISAAWMPHELSALQFFTGRLRSPASIQKAIVPGVSARGSASLRSNWPGLRESPDILVASDDQVNWRCIMTKEHKYFRKQAQKAELAASRTTDPEISAEIRAVASGYRSQADALKAKAKDLKKNKAKGRGPKK